VLEIGSVVSATRSHPVISALSKALTVMKPSLSIHVGTVVALVLFDQRNFRSSTRSEENAMMTSELRYLLKTNSNCEACSDQASLCALLTDLRAVADDLDLDFAGANIKAATQSDWHNQWPCI
jgi:hypothetical protein